MPKGLFYAGAVFCLFLALVCLEQVVPELAATAFPGTLLTIAVALAAGLGVAGLFLRMAALLAARNLFASFVALLCVTATMVSLAGASFLHWRIETGHVGNIDELRFAAVLAVGFFVSLSLLSLRPYFSIQASRLLSVLVFFPLPLFALAIANEVFLAVTPAALPGPTPASRVFFSVLAVLFVSIAVHCIRHRHLFLEMTNLRELLDRRVDSIGGVAFDS